MLIHITHIHSIIISVLSPQRFVLFTSDLPAAAAASKVTFSIQSGGTAVTAAHRDLLPSRLTFSTARQYLYI